MTDQTEFQACQNSSRLNMEMTQRPLWCSKINTIALTLWSVLLFLYVHALLSTCGCLSFIPQLTLKFMLIDFTETVFTRRNELGPRMDRSFHMLSRVYNRKSVVNNPKQGPAQELRIPQSYDWSILWRQRKSGPCCWRLTPLGRTPRWCSVTCETLAVCGAGSPLCSAP